MHKVKLMWSKLQNLLDKTGDMDGLDGGPGPPPPGSKGGKSRRASMIDLLNQGGKMGAVQAAAATGGARWVSMHWLQALALLRGEGQDGAAEQEAAEEAAGPVW
ncbi:hypothetical protein HaLaN_18123 [Haematococcus lacustris]|uniref:Uncharacterized protein n=1 Tax=Haematococcus lacustris TaxID=44745 RepID=A0A699ZPV6_HAELA|nr:hypothetical protein HaLaN_18123 [Haematococcus lacustris]